MPKPDKPTQRPGPKGHGEQVRLTAQSLYEGDPSITTVQIAEQAGISVRTLQAWAVAGGWKRSEIQMTSRAQMIADQFQVALDEIGPEATDAQKEVIAADIIEKDLTGQRADVVARHRKEWNTVRALLYRSINLARTATGFEAAKFSKISAETLAIIQASERKAWGMDAKGDDDNVVVIERKG